MAMKIPSQGADPPPALLQAWQPLLPQLQLAQGLSPLL